MKTDYKRKEFRLKKKSNFKLKLKLKLNLKLKLKLNLKLRRRGGSKVASIKVRKHAYRVGRQGVYDRDESQQLRGTTKKRKCRPVFNKNEKKD